jgi:hypothetical protein
MYGGVGVSKHILRKSTIMLEAGHFSLLAEARIRAF